MSSPRRYEESHPWITFEAQRELDGAGARIWVLLGQVTALCQHLADTPLLPDYARELQLVYLAKGARATAAIEGNTLSEDQVKLLIADQLRLPPSKDYLRREVDNVVSIMNQTMKAAARGEQVPLTPGLIHDLNRTLLKELPLDEGVTPGEVHLKDVAVGPYKGPNGADCEYLLDRLCRWLNEEFPRDYVGLSTAILRAIIAHLYLAWIHAFGDGNGRTARAAEAHLLIMNGVPAPAAHLLTNHYNETRSEYYRQLDYASKSGGRIVPFLLYALQGFYDGLQEQLAVIRKQHLELMWNETVDTRVKGSSPTNHRRRELAKVLFGSSEPMSKAQMIDHPRLVRLYASKTEKTMTRDLGVLLDASLVERRRQGRYRAAVELVTGLLPPAARPNDLD